MEGLLVLLVVVGLLSGLSTQQHGVHQIGGFTVTVTGVHRGVAAQPHLEKFNKSRARAEQNLARLPSG